MAKTNANSDVPVFTLRDGKRIAGKLTAKSNDFATVEQKSGQAYNLPMGEALSKCLADTKVGTEIVLMRVGSDFKLA